MRARLDAIVAALCVAVATSAACLSSSMDLGTPAPSTTTGGSAPAGGAGGEVAAGSGGAALGGGGNASGGTGDGGTAGGGGSPDDRRLRYYVLPHPDDEHEAWSFLDGDTTHYVVLILLTRGEQSGYCSGSGYNAGTGEREPQPSGFEGQWSANCAAQRLDSWHYFLDAMAASANPELGTVVFVRHADAPGMAGSLAPRRCDSLDPAPYSNCYESRGYDLWVGPSSARIAFDLGDGDVTTDEIEWAITATRSLAAEFPVQTEDDLIAASYRNVYPANGYEYPHVDHTAVHEVLWYVDFGLPGPQIAATAAGDPDSSITRSVRESTFQAAWAIGANDTRVGWGQIAYGWLTGSYWPTCATTADCLLAKEQRFWSRF